MKCHNGTHTVMGHMQRLHLKIAAIKSAGRANDSAKGDLGGQQTG